MDEPEFELEFVDEPEFELEFVDELEFLDEPVLAIIARGKFEGHINKHKICIPMYK